MTVTRHLKLPRYGFQLSRHVGCVRPTYHNKGLLYRLPEVWSAAAFLYRLRRTVEARDNFLGREWTGLGDEFTHITIHSVSPQTTLRTSYWDERTWVVAPSIVSAPLASTVTVFADASFFLM